MGIRLATAAALCLTGLLFQRDVMAQDPLKDIVERLQRGYNAERECFREVAEDPLAIRVRREIFPRNTDPNRYELLASTEKLSDDQKRLLIDMLQLNTKCRRIGRSGEEGTPLLRVSNSYLNQLDHVYGQLLRGEISIGRANSDRQKINDEYQAERKRAWAELTAALAPRATSNAGSDNSSGSSPLLPFLMQQHLLRESNDAAARRNRELIDAVKPRPTQTDCTRDGWGNVSCTTR